MMHLRVTACVLLAAACGEPTGGTSLGNGLVSIDNALVRYTSTSASSESTMPFLIVGLPSALSPSGGTLTGRVLSDDAAVTATTSADGGFSLQIMASSEQKVELTYRVNNETVAAKLTLDATFEDLENFIGPAAALPPLTSSAGNGTVALTQDAIDYLGYPLVMFNTSSGQSLLVTAPENPAVLPAADGDEICAFHDSSDSERPAALCEVFNS